PLDLALPSPTASEQQQSAAPKAQQQAAQQPPAGQAADQAQPKPAERAERDDKNPAEQSGQAPSPPAPPPEPAGGAAAGAPDSPPPAGSAEAFGVPPTALSSELFAMYNLRVPGEFDAPAYRAAEMSRDEAGLMRSQLRKCWDLPADLASTSARVVLRLFLNPDGTLADEPMLIEATASADGPVVMMAAKRAVEGCAPYAFLPREKYSEWKQLDIGFSPREMGQGS
ncbi:MAG: hypothetical protein J0H62_11980, partial [Rhizobiales bacterium]|nr:hypothetical protein [Hyphomicrobiales bacterium]